jgi:hypothetical protein
MTEQPDAVTPPRKTKDAIKRARALRRWFGRPTAAQNRLLEQLLAALVVDFEEGGQEAIEKVRLEDPVNYLQLIAVMVPKPKMDLSGRLYSDEDVAEAVVEAREAAAAIKAHFGVCIDGNGQPEEAPALPALPPAE